MLVFPQLTRAIARSSQENTRSLSVAEIDDVALEHEFYG
jgi:hypothetical protein